MNFLTRRNKKKVPDTEDFNNSMANVMRDYDISREELNNKIKKHPIKFNLGDKVIINHDNIKKNGTITEIPDEDSLYLDQILSLDNGRKPSAWRLADCECVIDSPQSYYFAANDERHYAIQLDNVGWIATMPEKKITKRNAINKMKGMIGLGKKKRATAKKNQKKKTPKSKKNKSNTRKQKK